MTNRQLSRGATAISKLAHLIGYTDERSVLLGRADGTVIANRDLRLVYWRDEQAEGTAVLSTAVGIPFAAATHFAGLRVRIAKPPNRQEYYVIEMDISAYYSLAGLTPSERLINQALVASVRQTESLRLSAAEPPTFEVRVRGTYLFYDARSNWKFYTDSAVSLAGAQAALTANQHRFALIFLDETDGTIGFVASSPVAASAPLPSREEFTFVSFMNIQLLGEKRPIGAVYLYHGQTAVTEADIYREYGFARFERRGLQHNLNASANPTAGDDVDAGYSIGSLWLNTANDTAWLCLDNTTGAAVWKQIDASGGGTVTSVALAMPSQFSVTGSPVTTSGTLTAAWQSQSANTVLAAPSNTSGTPTFRTLTADDIAAGVPPGAAGNVLTSNGTTWVSQANVASSPTTTHGDMIVRGASVDERLPIGADGAFLRVDNSAPLKVAWQQPVSAMTSASVQQRVLLAEATLSAPSNTIDIQNIPASYDALYIEASLSTTAASEQGVWLYLNGDYTHSNYVRHFHVVTDGSAHSVSAQSAPAGSTLPISTQFGGVRTQLQAHIAGYGSAGAQKIVSTQWRFFRSQSEILDEVVRWTGTAAVNRITLRMDNLSMQMTAGSQLRVYGVRTAPLELLIPAVSDVSVEQKVLIGEVVLSAPANAMTVSGIPGTYDSLYIQVGVSTTHSSFSNAALNVNNDLTAGNYSRAIHFAEGSSHIVATLTQGSVLYAPPSSINSGMRGFLEVQIPDYANTTRQKLFITRGSAFTPTGFLNLEITRWNNTAAIHTINYRLENASHNFTAGSWMRVYGVRTAPLVVSVPNLSSFSLVSTGAFNFGDPDVDGTWRMVRSGNNLLIQRRESGNWVTKQTFTP